MGYKHLETAEVYPKFIELGPVLRSVPRHTYFLTTKVDLTVGSRRRACKDSGEGCFTVALAAAQEVVGKLGVKHVDLLMLHRPPVLTSGGAAAQCARVREQWRALEQLHHDGVARAIGVSNFCVPLVQCLLQTARVRPAVVSQMHRVGMGHDPYGFVSWCAPRPLSTQSRPNLDPISRGCVTHIGAYSRAVAAWPYLRAGPLLTRTCEIWGDMGEIWRDMGPSSRAHARGLHPLRPAGTRRISVAPPPHLRRTSSARGRSKRLGISPHLPISRMRQVEAARYRLPRLLSAGRRRQRLLEAGRPACRGLRRGGADRSERGAGEALGRP